MNARVVMTSFVSMIWKEREIEADIILDPRNYIERSLIFANMAEVRSESPLAVQRCADSRRQSAYHDQIWEGEIVGETQNRDNDGKQTGNGSREVRRRQRTMYRSIVVREDVGKKVRSAFALSRRWRKLTRATS